MQLVKRRPAHGAVASRHLGGAGEWRRGRQLSVSPIGTAAASGDDGGANYALPASIGGVAATNEHLPGRELTGAQIARGEHGATLRSRGTRWHPSASGEGGEDALQVGSRMPTSQSGTPPEPPPPPQWRYEPVSSGSGGHARRHPTSAQRLLPVVRGVRPPVTQSLARRQTMRRAAISRACA